VSSKQVATFSDFKAQLDFSGRLLLGQVFDSKCPGVKHSRWGRPA